MNYFFESFQKFRKDALSKAIYDFLKYIFSAIVLVQILKYIPIAENILVKKIQVSIWEFISYILFSILLSFGIYYLRFKNTLLKIRTESQTDELTGLKNYKALDDRLSTIFAEKTSHLISFILMDIDNFKHFNETFSYDVADKIMAKLGDLLEKDSRITDSVYRYYLKGDEFLIIANQTNISNAQLAADRKRQLIKDTNFNLGKEIFNLTVSCGVTTLTSSDDKDSLKERLSQALKKAKSHPNKNRVEIIV